MRKECEGCVDSSVYTGASEHVTHLVNGPHTEGIQLVGCKARQHQARSQQRFIPGGAGAVGEGGHHTTKQDM